MTANSASALSNSTISYRVPGYLTQAAACFAAVHELSLTVDDLRATRAAVVGLPLLGFHAVDKRGYDFSTKSYWMYSYVVQVSDPAISNFSVARDGARFRVFLDNGLRITAEWRSFSTISHAVEAIRRHVEDVLSLDKISCLP